MPHWTIQPAFANSKSLIKSIAMKKYILPSFFFSLLLTISCTSNDELAANLESDTGVGGSYARFLALNDHLYVVDNTSIKTFNLSDESNPFEVDKQEIGERIESIFHFDNRLFIGSGAGLFIYQIGLDGIPTPLAATEYFETFDTFACDPVVANTTHAYVTLNSLEAVERPCGDGEILNDVNELRVYDITEITAPQLIAQYPFSAPKGVGIDGDLLFICDNDQGLKIFNIENPQNIQEVQTFGNFTAFDVITLNGTLLVVGPDNVYQFNYTDPADIKLISTIPYGA